MSVKKFSTELEEWLGSKKPKTIESLNEAFVEKGFAIVFMLLMFLPALPLPTGGITHIFEIITMLLSLELLVGRKTIWLPKRWQGLKLKGIASPKASRQIIKYVKKVEAVSRPRLPGLFSNWLFIRLFALLTFGFTFVAFAAPPFSGLDTLPSLCVVLMSLAFIFEDLALFAAALFAGLAGVAVDLTIGLSGFKIFHRLF